MPGESHQPDSATAGEQRGQGVGKYDEGQQRCEEVLSQPTVDVLVKAAC